MIRFIPRCLKAWLASLRRRFSSKAPSDEESRGYELDERAPQVQHTDSNNPSNPQPMVIAHPSQVDEPKPDAKGKGKGKGKSRSKGKAPASEIPAKEPQHHGPPRDAREWWHFLHRENAWAADFTKAEYHRRTEEIGYDPRRRRSSSSAAVPAAPVAGSRKRASTAASSGGASAQSRNYSRPLSPSAPPLPAHNVAERRRQRGGSSRRRQPTRGGEAGPRTLAHRQRGVSRPAAPAEAIFVVGSDSEAEAGRGTEGRGKGKGAAE